MYGKLTTICGPMYASKSTEILKRVLWAKNGLERDVHVFKIAFDNRYSETEIVNHDGLRATAKSISSIEDIPNEQNTIVFFDEIQFFNSDNFDGDVVQWIKNMLNNNIEVVVAGLDMDWKGAAFPITGTLLAMSDEVIKSTANCTVCGRPAHKTYKKSQAGGSVELGAGNEYEARCNTHWICA